MKPPNFFNYLIAVILTLSIFVLVYALIEFHLTEVWMLMPRVSPLISSLFLLVLIFILNLFDWGSIIRRNKPFLVFLVIVILSGLIFWEYRQQKLDREYLPKIYSINSPKWGIQACVIEIKGVNFFPAHRKGRALLDGEELLIEEWSDDLVIAKQQVPSRFGRAKLYLVREDGMMSNSIPYEIKNPNELLTF